MPELLDIRDEAHVLWPQTELAERIDRLVTSFFNAEKEQHE